MSHYPLTFRLRDIVQGNGFVATVAVQGRALLHDEGSEGVWIEGVNPGGFAATACSVAEANKLGSPEATAMARAWRIAVAALLVVAATTGHAATHQPRESPQERPPPAAPVDEPLRGAAALEALQNLARAAPFAQGGSVMGAVSAGPNVPGAFKIRMAIPGGAGPEVKVDVVSLGPRGGPIDPPGDPALLPGLPPTALVGENGLVMRRMSDVPWQEAYMMYESEPVVVLSDLRASRAYARTAAEDALCPRLLPHHV